MKAKQLPDDLEEWLNSQTIVIGVTSLQPMHTDRPEEATTRRGNWSGRHPQRLFVCLHGSSSCRFSECRREVRADIAGRKSR